MLAAMLVRVGFSADPDDAFMYWGIASGSVDRRGFDFEPVIEDIQTLNEWSLEGRLEVTAMPGTLTTPVLVLPMARGEGIAVRALPFDEIIDPVTGRHERAGLLI